jgi:UDP-N-acetylglucosamine--N-acetylmuramyl-(pentapeptide) pyrophosphoryl-undecaprenol N-acetylglucosamine transferase
MRVLIAAGGTGGHIYPGIAVAKELVRRNPESRVRFVGTIRGLESKLVPQAGFELAIIESAGLKNVGLLSRARGLLILPRSFAGARKLIKEFQPDVVVGAGGYVSGPVVLTAVWLRLPTMIMESNALPGWTNRVLARFVDKAAVSFDAALPFFRGKGVVTGNPVRREFFEIQPRTHTGKELSLLVFGGSQGARAINDAMVSALPLLDAMRARLKVVHQTGAADFERIKAAYTAAGWSESDVRRYIDDMVTEFASADVVICRAGATTTAELIAAGKASIMIPFPFAADDHQRKNAEALEAEGAAKMILQQDLSPERLANEIVQLAEHPEMISQIEKAAKLLAHGDAAASAAQMIEELTERK